MLTKQSKMSIQCEICREVFQNKHSLKNHKTLMHSVTSCYVCHFCEKHFNKKFNLQRHVRNVHKTIRHKCKHCGKQFKSLNVLLKHELGKVCQKNKKNSKRRYFCKKCTNISFNSKEGFVVRSPNN